MEELGRGKMAIASQSSGYDAHPCQRAQPLMCSLLCLALGLFLSAPAAIANELPPLLPLDDVVFISAQQGHQGIDQDEFEARGALRMRGAQWEIYADRATVYGPLRDPESIRVAGTPARIVYRRNGDDEPLEGHSELLEFEPRRDIVRLESGAKIVKGRQSISSETIKYLLERDTFTAGSGGRVTVVTKPR